MHYFQGATKWLLADIYLRLHYQMYLKILVKDKLLSLTLLVVASPDIDSQQSQNLGITVI